jgi:competence protein ComEA
MREKGEKAKRRKGFFPVSFSPPHFSRSQLGVALILGAALFFLWAWRANFFLAPSPAPTADLTRIFVEIKGAVAHPGVYAFDRPPTLAEVWRQAGEAGAPPPGPTPLHSGSRVEVGQDGRYTLGRMSGAQLVTLGLPLDANTASAADLDALPGVGPALAGRIVAYRQEHGPFRKIDDLLGVSGVGEQNLEKLRPLLALGNVEAGAPIARETVTAAPGEQGQKPGSGRRGKSKAPARPINPNLAAAAELEALPGIGPVLARRIIDYRRSHGAFKKIDDLLGVSGIGPKKLAKMKAYLTIKGNGKSRYNNVKN